MDHREVVRMALARMFIGLRLSVFLADYEVLVGEARVERNHTLAIPLKHDRRDIGHAAMSNSGA